MADSNAQLSAILTAAAGGRGTASLSVVEPGAAGPTTCWVPDSAEEPAFLVYSITKTITAALVLKLCEEGRLGLDDPLVRWFPHIDRAAHISIRHLLNHTAGIPDYGGLAAYHDGLRATPSQPWSFERFAAETFDRGLLFAPGQGWAYSNPGYMLVKRIVERVTGLGYRDLVGQRIARPLGLDRTFVAESLADLAPLAPGSSALLTPDGAPRDVRAHYHPGWVSHGVVRSTSSEIVRIFDAFFHGGFLSRESRRQMLEMVPVSAGDSPLCPGRPGYGLGVMGDPASRWGLIAGHNGGGPCYSASAFHAFDLGGVSICALGAIEEEFSAEGVVVSVLDRYTRRGA